MNAIAETRNTEDVQTFFQITAKESPLIANEIYNKVVPSVVGVNVPI